MACSHWGVQAFTSALCRTCIGLQLSGPSRPSAPHHIPAPPPSRNLRAKLPAPPPTPPHLVHVLPQRVVVVKGAAAEVAVGVRGGGVRLQRLRPLVRLQLQGEQAPLLRRAVQAGARAGWASEGGAATLAAQLAGNRQQAALGQQAGLGQQPLGSSAPMSEPAGTGCTGSDRAPGACAPAGRRGGGRGPGRGGRTARRPGPCAAAGRAGGGRRGGRRGASGRPPPRRGPSARCGQATQAAAGTPASRAAAGATVR
jgi:hypothetical protein